jgi:hypothetical protein
MTDDGSRRQGDGWVGPLLKAEAERHEPDQLRILTAVRDGIRQQRTSLPRRWAAPTAAAAAAVLLIGGVMVGVLATRGPAQGQPGAGPGATASASTTEPTGSEAGPTSVPVTSGAVGAPASGTVAVGDPATPPTTGPTTPSASSAGPGGAPPATVSVGRADTRVTLDDSVRDWAGIGLRQDGVVVRRKAGGRLIGEPRLFGDTRTTLDPGPFRVSWSGGAPEQDHADAGTWFVVRPGRPGVPTGYSIEAAGVRRGTLTVLCGAVGAAGRVEVLVDGRTVSSSALPVGARQVRVGFEQVTALVQVRLVAAPSGGIGVAAAVLS